MTRHGAVPRFRTRGGAGPLAALLMVLAVVAALLALAVPAQAADPATPEEIGKGLRAEPVYVDDAARERLSRAEQDALSQKIESTDRPVYVIVLPDDPAYHQQTVLSDIREATGRAGVYGVLLGDDFGAAADTDLMSAGTAQSLARETEQHGTVDAASLGTFVDTAAAAVGDGTGSAADGNGNSNGNSGAPDGSPGFGGLALGVLMLGGLASLAFLTARNARRVRRENAAELERVKATVDEDVTAYGEELDRLDFRPGAPGGATREENEALLRDYTEALDAYEEAKSAMRRVRSPRDVQAVTSELEAGRFALTTLRARRAGEPLPERRSPCFFDPRHGPSVDDRQWAPEGGEPRAVPVCAADAARLDDGEPPMAREVETARGRRPYWEAGPAYGPWAGGFFGGYGTSMMSGMLIGTMLGSSMGAGTAWAGDADAYGGDYGGDSFGGGFDGGGGGFGGGFDGGGFGGGF
ncbi:hypothetical protein [Streptomyces sp. HNM0574]|uniref:hypothetical protein n=1 Tax=Streptomyces sp. HNM0574 TaxID=2714954 RepID=UPI00146C4C26|nr:hypothetical protein [Streptomyces sp. HNM0574]NLU68881.1 hypothetical protein [Streptomyces sp. HNM0574]